MNRAARAVLRTSPRPPLCHACAHQATTFACGAPPTEAAPRIPAALPSPDSPHGLLAPAHTPHCSPPSAHPTHSVPHSSLPYPRALPLRMTSFPNQPLLSPRDLFSPQHLSLHAGPRQPPPHRPPSAAPPAPSLHRRTTGHAGYLPTPLSPWCPSQSGPGQMIVDGDSLRTNETKRGHAAGKEPAGHGASPPQAPG